MKVETRAYRADDVELISSLYYDEHRSGRRPAVLVFPEAFGLNEHAKDRARRLAELGYVALACDVYGSGRVALALNEVHALAMPLRRDTLRMRARASASLQALVSHTMVDPSRVAAVGYCMGGLIALELARAGADLVGVVGFHSGVLTAIPDEASQIKGRVLMCMGAEDPVIPLEHRAAFEREMRDGKVAWEMHVFGGVAHSFTNPAAGASGVPVFRYDDRADKRSWEMMKEFLAEVFGQA